MFSCFRAERPGSSSLGRVLGFVFLALAAHAAAEPVQIVSLAPAETWHRAEFRIENAPRTANNFDPNLVQIDAAFTAPSGHVTRVPAFWFQDFTHTRNGVQDVYTPVGESWRIRFTPTETGDYTLAVSIQTGDAAHPVAEADAHTPSAATLHFSVKAAPGPIKQRWVGNVADERSFETDDHQPLRLVGENICWSGARGGEDFATWFKAIENSGGNFARIWLCPWSLGIEHVPGSLNHYQQKQAFQLDQVFNEAERDGLYLMLCLDHHGMFQIDNTNWDSGNNFWKTNPYNIAQGGPCVAPDDFFTNPQAQEIYRKRLRYLIGRYGCSPALLSWEFFNEIDNVYAPHQSLVPADVAAWHRSMGQWLHANDPYHHLVSTSLTGGSDRPEIWSDPEMDFAMYHSYGDPAPAQLLAHLTEDFHQRYHKPVVIAEFGVSAGAFDLPEDPHLRGFRQLLWGGAVGGSVGSGMSWWWENIHDEHVYLIFKALTGIMSHAGWGRGSWAPIAFPEAQPQSLGEMLPNEVPFDANVALSSYRRMPISDEVVIANPLSAERAGEQLSKFLLGTSEGARHQPIKLTARFSALGKLSFKVDSVASDVELIVTVDGAEKIHTRIFDRDGKAAVNHEIDRPYAVEIPAGPHIIQILNTGSDWAVLDDLKLEGVEPSAFATGAAFAAEKIGIADSEHRRAVLYVCSPWIVYPAGAYHYQPPLVENEVITVPNWSAGKARVEFFNSETGALVAETKSQTSAGALSIKLPAFREDLAVVVSPIQ